MFSIIDCERYHHTEGYNILAEIDVRGETLEVACQLPKNTRIALDLRYRGKSNILDKRYFRTGEKLSVSLKECNSDTFSLYVSDENGKTVMVYHIVRSYC